MGVQECARAGAQCGARGAHPAGSAGGTLEGIQDATVKVQQATRDVHAEVQRLVDETGRAQHLAVWVAIGTGLGGAILGGFAGAIAARFVGA
ncbi:putative methyl-accepting chemotaxis protein [Nocardioides sp. PD653]|nr:Putative methyl-accepting chemotaxis protein [Nocardioides sp. PD653-B2]GAW54069.1 putative methyl-accepting chemotaxis protein [Nocardioides sp. PD653]